MTRLLIFMPGAYSGSSYAPLLRAKFPDLDVVAAASAEEGVRLAESAEILIGYMATDALLRTAKKLRWIQALGTGVDGFTNSRELRKDVLVSNTRGIQGAPVSEAVLAGMLALSRHLAGQVRNQDRRIWGDGWTTSHTPTLLQGKTVGILGVGLIAEALAPKCKAFGMTVIGVSRRRDVPGFDEMHAREELLDVVPRFDYLVALVPGSPENNRIVDADVFAAMKPSAHFLNVARGSVVDEEALIEALQTGRIAGAALDVFAKEPLPQDSPLWSMENVLITPHRAGLSDVYTELSMPIIEENIRRFLAGDLDNMINLIER